MLSNYPKNFYSKKSTFKWVLICLVAGAAIYGLIYYFWSGKHRSYNYNTPNDNYEQNASTIKSDQDLLSASTSLDSADINQIDSGLNQNDADAVTF